MKPPIINCHTHVFTGDMVPKFLAKKFILWPVYYLLPVSMVIGIGRWWYKYPGAWPHLPWYKNLQRRAYTFAQAVKQHGLKHSENGSLIIHLFHGRWMASGQGYSLYVFLPYFFPLPVTWFSLY